MYTNLYFQWSLGTGLWGRLVFFTDFVKANILKITFQQFLKITIKNMKLMVKRKFWGTSFKSFKSNLLDLSLNICILRISDTAGQEDYANVRLLAYPGTDVVIMAFNIMSRPSFENITETWNKEKVQHMKKAKVGKHMSIWLLMENPVNGKNCPNESY